MKNENNNNNKKIIAEVEIRLGLKVYKMEIHSQFRWLWLIAFYLIKYFYEFVEKYF